MQYVIKGIYDILKEYNNLEVKLSKEETLFEDVNDNLSLLVDIYNFNPHIIISINHVFQFINEKVFNFIWFQDEMPFLKDKTVYNKREREYIFSLTKFHDKLLQDKGIPYQRQNFAINDKIFKINNNIQREEKIVFIGSAYINSIDFSSVPNELIDKLVNNYENGEEFSSSYIEHISDEYNISKEILEGKVIPYIVRDFAVRWLCSSELSKKIKIEIYGWGWDKYPETKQYFKGKLKHGQALANVYSSAKYTLAPHSIYIIQQRVLEAIFCGCQPGRRRPRPAGLSAERPAVGSGAARLAEHGRAAICRWRAPGAADSRRRRALPQLARRARGDSPAAAGNPARALGERACDGRGDDGQGRQPWRGQRRRRLLGHAQSVGAGWLGVSHQHWRQPAVVGVCAGAAQCDKTGANPGPRIIPTRAIPTPIRPACAIMPFHFYF
jgi:hypothetical protein